MAATPCLENRSRSHRIVQKTMQALAKSCQLLPFTAIYGRKIVRLAAIELLFLPSEGMPGQPGSWAENRERGREGALVKRCHREGIERGHAYSRSTSTQLRQGHVSNARSSLSSVDASFARVHASPTRLPESEGHCHDSASRPYECHAGCNQWIPWKGTPTGLAADFSFVRFIGKVLGHHDRTVEHSLFF